MIIQSSKVIPRIYLFAQHHFTRNVFKQNKWQISFTVCAVSFIFGVCSTLLFENLISGYVLALIMFTLIVLIYRQPLVFPLIFLFVGLSWATLVFSIHFNTQLPKEHEGQTILITGDVVNLPEMNTQSSRFKFRINEANSTSGLAIPQLTNQTVILSCYRCQLSFQPDQSWLLSVRLKRPHSYASWGAFDYEKYLFRNKIIATGYIREKDNNDLLSSNTGLSIHYLRGQIRDYLRQTLLNNTLGQAVIAALMIGEKSQLNKHQQLVFQKSGISHLMAISGLHIGLAFLAMAWLLKCLLFPVAQIYTWLPRQRIILLPSLLTAYSYAALAGFAISTQRAIIMLSIFVLAKFIAREMSLLKVLMISIVLIFIYDPLSILDVGFWLSCSAVLIIALVIEHQKFIAGGVTGTEEEANSQKLSLIKLQPLLWVGMLPTTLLFFGGISMLSPLVNLVMVPLFCSVLIPLTLIALLLKILSLEVLSDFLLQLLAVSYQKIYWGLEFLTELSFAQIMLPPMRISDWLIFALVVISYFFAWRSRHALLCLFIALLISLNIPKNYARDEFSVTLLDVGQGLAMVVEASDYVLVYDTGPAYSSGFNTADAVLIPYLRRQGIRKIDKLIVSHADNDHIGGLDALSAAYEINKIVTSRVDKIPNASPCLVGQTWSVANIDFTILSPDQSTPKGSNNHSCVLMLSNGQKKVLISGDIEYQVERYLLKSNIDIAADILLVPHQGSKTSSTPDFIDAVAPQLALIAAGYRNHYGHPHSDVIKRYQSRNIDLLSTIKNGSISLNIKGNEVKINGYRQTNKHFWNRIKS